MVAYNQQALILAYSLDEAFIDKHTLEDTYTLEFVFRLTEVKTKLDTTTPDLILVNDANACQQIRNLTSLPILFLGDFDSIDAALKNGATDCLRTPVHPHLLQRRISQMLHHILLTQAENKLSESEQRYRHLFESATEGIIITALPDGQILEVNPHLSKMLGYQREDLLMMNIKEIEVAKSSDEISTSLGEQDNHLIIEATYAHRDGRHIPVETSSRVIQFHNQAAILYFTRDVTERNKALQAEQDQRRLAEALRDTASAFSSAVNLEEILDIVMEHSTQIVPYINSANIMMLESERTHIVRHYGYEDAGYTDADLKAIQFHLDDVPNLKWVCDHKTVLVIEDTHNSDFEWADAKTSDFVRSMVTAPIIVDDEVLGFINLDSDRVGTFHISLGKNLRAFANQAAIAIKNARLFEKIQQDAEALDRKVQKRTRALGDVNRALRQQMIQLQEVENRLTEERTLLRTLIDNLPDSVTVKDKDGRIILINEAAKRVTESISGYYPADDYQSKTVHELHPNTEIADRLFAREMRVLRDGETIVNLEDYYTTQSGEDHAILVTKVPLRDNEGDIVGLIALNRDITELKQTQQKLDEERNIMRTLIDTIPDSIYVKDKDHRFVLVNQATVDYMPVETMDEVIGKTDADFYPERNVAEFIQHEKDIMESGQGQVNKTLSYVDFYGNRRHIIQTRLPLRDANGDVNGMIGINHDVTDLRTAEEQLEQVLTSARCLLWTAVVQYDEASDSYQWDLKVANEQAAQTFLPLATETVTYTQAWLDSLSQDDVQQRDKKFRESIATRRSDFSHEVQSLTQDATTMWLSEDVRLTSMGYNHWYVVGVCTDISAQKDVEVRLQQYNDELEARVAERTRALSEANETLAAEVAERKRAEESERRQRKLAEALRDSAAAINRTLDLDTVLDTILGNIPHVIPHMGATVFLLEKENIIRVVRQKGFSPDFDKHVFDISQWENYQEIIRTGQPCISLDIPRGTWETEAIIGWIRSSISVPIVLEDKIEGFLSVNSREPHTFTEEHADLFLTFAQQAGTAIRNSRLAEQTRDYATNLELAILEHTSKLEDERGQLYAILNAMQDGVIYQVGGLANTPQYINDAMVEMLGYTLEEWQTGKARHEANTQTLDELQDHFAKVERLLSHKGFWEGETVLRRKDGRTFDAGLVRSEARDATGERLGVVTVVRDISQEKQLAEQKARFIASASHELRTPIANMKTRLFLMRRRPERFMEHIEIAESVVNLMQNLVEDMFDIARFERGVIRLTPEEIVLQDIIRQIVVYQQPEAERKQIEIELDFPDDDVIMRADPYRLSQVLINLIKNALNYTPVEGNISVSLNADLDTVTIKVQDTGPGIPEDVQPELFQPFFRLTEDNKGAGLGLAIAREIVEAHQGTIHVQSTVDEGSCFIVEMPLHPTIDTTNLER